MLYPKTFNDSKIDQEQCKDKQRNFFLWEYRKIHLSKLDKSPKEGLSSKVLSRKLIFLSLQINTILFKPF